MNLILPTAMPPTAVSAVTERQKPATQPFLERVSRVVARSWRLPERPPDHRRLNAHMTSDIGLLPEQSAEEPLLDRGAVMWRRW